MKITHIITDGYLMGGAQLNTLYSLRYQQASHDVELIAGNTGQLTDACQKYGIPIHIIPIRNRLVDPLRDIRALYRLVRYLRRSKPDVVHTHSSKGGILGRCAAKLANVPVVVHTVHAFGFPLGQSALNRTLFLAIERFSTRLTDRLIAVADSLAADLIRHGICRPADICTVVSGIDFSPFPRDRARAREETRQKLNIPDEIPVVISVGHLFPRKAHELLIAAAAQIVAREQNVLFLIVGEGPERDRLQRLVDEHGVRQHVQLLGDRNDVPSLLAASDIFVQTSWYEGLSRSLVEALYSHLPAVATNVNATFEVVVEGETGFLVPSGEVDALAERLLLLLRDPELRQRLGDEAHRLVAGVRTVEAMGEALERVYQELLTARRRKVGVPGTYVSER